MEQNINSFVGGLDTRKFFLSMPPGVLTELENAHITQGAEIEKRKAWQKYPLPSATFGGQKTNDGIVIFGSRNMGAYPGTFTIVSGDKSVEILLGANASYAPAVGDPITVTGSGNANINGTWPVIGWAPSGDNDGTGLVTFKIAVATAYSAAESTTLTPYIAPPIIYQQLIHPLGSGVTMTGVISSTYFDGSTQATATWSNGDRLVYNGTEVETDFYVGSQCNITPTPYSIATSLVAQATATGLYTGINPVLPTALSFQITGGTNSAGVNTVSVIGYNFNRQVTLNNGVGAVTSSQFFILAPPVDWVTSNNATAAAIVTAINSNLGGLNPYGFVAAAPGASNTITITPPSTDFYGNVLTISDFDTLTVQATGNVSVFIPPYAATFDILSIPSESSPNPFSVATTVFDAGLPYKLVSSGLPSTLPIGAAGQFAISAGLQNAQGTGTLTISGSGPANNDTITIGPDVYTFVTALGRPANQILIGSTIDATLGNLIAAWNGASGAGTKYSSSTSPSPRVFGGNIVSHASIITASPAGTPGNIAVSESATGLAWSGLSGGATGTLVGGTDTNQLTQITVDGISLLSNPVPFNSSINQTANDVVTSINNFSGTSGFSASANQTVPNIITILSNDGGTAVNNALVSLTTAGGFCVDNCYFQVYVQAGTKNITAIAPASGAGTNLLSATMTYQDGGHPSETVAQFVGRVATNINARTGTSGYVASASGIQLNISLAVTTSAITDPLLRVTYGAGLLIVQGQVTVLAATANTTTISASSFDPNSHQKKTVNAPNSAVITVTGGAGTYKYVWARTSGIANTGQNNGGVSYGFIAQVSGTKNQWWTITQPLAIYGPPSGIEIWTCTVTDGVGSSPVVLTFTLVA